MRKTIITLVVAVASLVPAAAWADGMPPSASKATERAPADASKVTMSDLAPDAPGEYTVAKGDTLWGIASRFLKDPWKWPQIWEMNRDQIKDPHWIYPGNVIRLDTSSGSPRLTMGASGGPGGGTGAGPSGGTEAEATSNVVRLDPRIRIEGLTSAVPSIPGSAIGPFLSQPLVIEEGGLAGAPTIVATEESRVIVGAGDLAYADRISSNDGVNWQVFRQGGALRDPETGEILGYEAKYMGDVRVRRFGDPTTIEVTKARREINRGDRLTPAREVSFPSYVPHAPDKPVRAQIMSVEEGVSELGQFQIITINRGGRDGIEVGDVLASYHKGAVVSASGQRRFDLEEPSWLTRMWYRMKTAVRSSDAPPAEGEVRGGASLAGQTITLPDERNGLVFVFRVFEKMSYGIVMKAVKPIYVGDILTNP
jgi:LysM repeat protein